MKILGLDISSNTGWSFGDFIKDDYGNVELQNHSVGKIHHPNRMPKSKGSQLIHPMDRLFDYINDFYLVVSNPMINKIDLVVIEGYAFSSKQSKDTTVLQVSIGTMMRKVLWDLHIPYIEVPPTSLKMFVTGKGQIKKNLMLMEVYKRWGYEAKDDDIADAYSLMAFGAALHDLIKMPQKNMSALDRVKESDLYEKYLQSIAINHLTQ